MNLLVCPWEVPNLGLEQGINALLAIEREPSTPHGVVLTDGRYLLEAHKPG